MIEAKSSMNQHRDGEAQSQIYPNKTDQMKVRLKMRRTRFQTWAKRNPDDTTPMRITFNTYDDKVMHLESGKEISYSLMWRVQSAWIESVNLINDEWHIVIYED